MKNLKRFIKTESPDSWLFILGMGVLAGLLSGLLLAIINAAAVIAAASEEINKHYFLMFAASVAALTFAKHKALVQTTEIVETMLKDLRVRVSNKIRNSELIYIEPLQKTDAFTKIAYDTNSISQASLAMTNAAQSLITLLVALAYLAWLSMPAFIVSMAVFVLIYFSFSARRKAIQTQLGTVIALEAQLLGALNHIFDGFKELKMNRKKSDALFARFRETASKNCSMKIDVSSLFIKNLLVSEVIFFGLLAGLIFILPRYLPAYTDKMLQITSTIMYISGPLSLLIGSIPVFARADTALANLYGLEEAVDKAFTRSKPNGGGGAVSFQNFQEITLEHASFSYLDAGGAPTFSVGPISLGVQRGEILFIVGGNGAGKSTMLKMLTSLYPVQDNAIRIDGVPLKPATAAEYRELFGIVFTDFHLFDRLYGLEGVTDEDVTRLIRDMELADKVSFSGGRFNTLNLSTGQRKRLGLIVAMLENKPIYIFDEWAADQDQRFRRHFYEVILKQLKAAGKTVIAVTHDDRYWRHADRVVKFEEGRIVQMAAGSEMSENGNGNGNGHSHPPPPPAG